MSGNCEIEENSKISPPSLQNICFALPIKYDIIHTGYCQNGKRFSFHQNEYILRISSITGSKKGILDVKERNKLTRDFCAFVLGELNGNSYSDVISATRKILLR